MNILHYVYQLKTSDGDIIYIGKGQGNRMYKHTTIAKGKSVAKLKNPKLYNKILKLLNSGKYIIPEIIYESNSELECLSKEVEIIAEIGKENLCNLTDGGEGTSGYHLSKETKKKMSDYKKNHPEWKNNPNRVFSDVARKKISDSKKGKPGYWKNKKLSDETKKKMSDAKLGKKFSYIHKDNLSKSLSGRTLTDEHKKNLSESNKNTYKLKKQHKQKSN